VVQRVEKVVGHDANRVLAAARPQRDAGTRQLDLRVVDRVEDARVQPAGVEVTLQRLMVHPKREILFGEIRHDVNNLLEREVAHRAHLFERLEHEVAELARPGAQLDDVQRLAVVELDRRVRAAAVTDEAVQHLKCAEQAGYDWKAGIVRGPSEHLCVAFPDECVARDEVRNDAL
jgi:hypothetical protein